MRPFRLFGLYFRVGVLNELQYRANLVAQLVQSVVAVGTGLAVLGLVFGQATNLAGWSQPQLLVVMGVHVLMGGLINTLIQPNMQRLMTDVREGTLDFLLTKPEDSQVLVSVRQVRIWQATDVLIGLLVLGWGIGQLGGRMAPLEVAAFLLALLLGALMIYCFWLIVTIGAFWIVRMDEVHELFEGLYQSGRWPVGIYPGWLRIMLTFLVPVAFAVTVPAEALTSRLTVEALGVAVVFAAALLAFTRRLWLVGLRRYSGASA